VPCRTGSAGWRRPAHQSAAMRARGGYPKLDGRDEPGSVDAGLADGLVGIDGGDLLMWSRRVAPNLKPEVGPKVGPARAC
jgi:hypothetical protein